MSIPLQQGIARLRGTHAGTPIEGTGFLVAAHNSRLGTHVITAAHVIKDILGSELPDDPRGAVVAVEFPFGGVTSRHLGRVVAWRAPAEDQATADIAVLELDSSPRSRRPYRLHLPPPPVDAPWMTMGFPVGQDQGMSAKGRVGAEVEHGRRILTADVDFGFFIEGGFSGAPVLDPATTMVLGLVVAATYDPTRRTAFALPCLDLARSWPPLVQPYRPLHTFQSDDAPLFFGREAHGLELIDKVASKPFVVLTGRSGSGKSSLVRAGLVPALLKASPWRIATMRPAYPFNDPIGNLTDTLAGCFFAGTTPDDADRQMHLAQAWRVQTETDPRNLAARVRTQCQAAGPGSPPILLIVDQLEELFTQIKDDGRRKLFIGALAALSDDRRGDSSVRVVATLRADYVDAALGLRSLADLMRDADVKLGAISPEELRRTIEEPAALLEVVLEQALVDRLLVDAGAERGDVLPLMQMTLARLWDRQADRRILLDEYERLGGLAKVLVQSADNKIGFLTLLHTESRLRRLLTDLVWVTGAEGRQDTRRVRRRSDYPDPDDWSAMEALAGVRDIAPGSREAASEARLVVLDGDGQTATAELVHEAIIRQWPQLQEWLRDDRRFRLWLQATEADAQRWAEAADPADSSHFLRGARLAEATRWRQERAAEEWRSVCRFLDASDEADHTEREAAGARQLEERRQLERLAQAEAEAARIAREGQHAAEEAAREADALRAQAETERAAAENAADEAQTLRAQAEIERAAALRSSRTARRALIIVGMMMAVAVAATGFAIGQLRTAHRERATGLAALSLQATERGDAMRGTLLALAASTPAGFEWLRPPVSLANAALLRARLMQRETATLLGHTGDIGYAAFGPDGRLVTVSGDWTARLWDLSGPRPVATVLEGHRGVVSHAAFGPGGRLVTVSRDSTARLWDLSGPRPVATVLEGHTGPVYHAAFGPDGRLVTVSGDTTARLWDLSGPRPVATVLEGHTDAVVHAAFGPDGHLVTVSGDRTARLWDLSGPRPVATVLEGHTDVVWHAAFGPDGRLVTVSWDRTARLWDLSGPRPVATVLEGHTDAVRHAAFGPDGRLVTVSEDRTARLWDLSGPRPVATVLESHTDAVWRAAFGPDGRLVTVSRDRTARLWDLSGPRPVATVLEGHTEPVYHAAFGPDGRLVTVSGNRTARLWDLSGPRPVATVLEGHTGFVNHAAFGPDGRLVTVSGDRTARLWDLSGPRPVATVLEGHTDVVNHAAFGPDGRLVTVSFDGTARLWPVADTGWRSHRASCRRITRGLTRAQQERFGLPSDDTSGIDRNAVPPPPNMTQPLSWLGTLQVLLFDVGPSMTETVCRRALFADGQ